MVLGGGLGACPLEGLRVVLAQSMVRRSAARVDWLLQGQSPMGWKMPWGVRLKRAGGADTSAATKARRNACEVEAVAYSRWNAFA